MKHLKLIKSLNKTLLLFSSYVNEIEFSLYTGKDIRVPLLDKVRTNLAPYLRLSKGRKDPKLYAKMVVS